MPVTPEHAGAARVARASDRHLLLAFDFGLRRIGIATANRATRTASPLTTLRVDRDAALGRHRSHHRRLAPRAARRRRARRRRRGGDRAARSRVRRGIGRALRPAGRNGRRNADLGRGGSRARGKPPIRVSSPPRGQGRRRSRGGMPDRRAMDETSSERQAVSYEAESRQRISRGCAHPRAARASRASSSSCACTRRAPRGRRRPGTFAHIACDPSVSRCAGRCRSCAPSAAEGWLEFLYKPQGARPRACSRRASPARSLSVLAPIGHGFTVDRGAPAAARARRRRRHPADDLPRRPGARATGICGRSC